MAVALALVGLAVYGSTTVSAQSPTPKANPIQSLVAKIAQKFNLNEAEVQAVFDEHRQEMHTTMRDKLEDRLSQAVTEGKLTEAQKQAILGKLAELESQKDELRDEFMNATPEERKEKMQSKRAELEAWAREQGIDVSVLMQYLRPLGGPGHHMKMHWKVN